MRHSFFEALLPLDISSGSNSTRLPGAGDAVDEEVDGAVDHEEEVGDRDRAEDPEGRDAAHVVRVLALDDGVQHAVGNSDCSHPQTHPDFGNWHNRLRQPRDLGGDSIALRRDRKKARKKARK